MKERPILFSDPMVRAILSGTKTQTRRVIKPQHQWFLDLSAAEQLRRWDERPFPHGRPGDKLWVREAHYIIGEHREVFFRATQDSNNSPPLRWPGPWRPSIHMPRWASRITLEITDVRAERLQSISEADAIAEGIERCEDFFGCPCWRAYGEPAGSDVVFPDNPIGSYASLWDSINGPGAWDANPWVWVIEFERITSTKEAP